jgi:hypothetical protein
MVDLPVVRPPGPDELRARFEVQALKLNGARTVVGLNAEPFSRIAEDVYARMPETQARVVLGTQTVAPATFPISQPSTDQWASAATRSRKPVLTPEAHTIALNTVTEGIAAVEA